MNSVNQQRSQTPTHPWYLDVPYCDRRHVHRRLQELSIPSWCLADGSLQVKIHDVATAFQVRSVVQQLRSTRAELVAWLDYCWEQSNGQSSVLP